MAMLRAENEGYSKFKVEVDIDDAYAIIDRNSFKGTKRVHRMCSWLLKTVIKITKSSDF
jgi:hypothetical protein